MGSARGQTFATEDALRAAALAAVTDKLTRARAPHLPTLPVHGYDAKSEQQAREVDARLRKALQDALAFGGGQAGDLPYYVQRALGPTGNALRMWSMLLAETPAVVNYLKSTPDQAPGGPRTWLKSFVAQWQKEGLVDDRLLALTALRAGWWPERMTTPVHKMTVPMVIDLARRAVKKVRTGN